MYLLTVWSVIVPVVVLERPGGLRALGRSSDLVRAAAAGGCLGWSCCSRAASAAPCRIGGAMSVLDLQNVVYREGEHYVAQCLNVDISSFGSSETDALKNLQEALELYLEDAPDDVVAAVDRLKSAG
jgi:hypothetical protein